MCVCVRIRVIVRIYTINALTCVCVSVYVSVCVSMYVSVYVCDNLYYKQRNLCVCLCMYSCVCDNLYYKRRNLCVRVCLSVSVCDMGIVYDGSCCGFLAAFQAKSFFVN